ncbi:transporter [Aliivibrio sp. EL58]|uniref:transporter n=1 Tax=Aliivibrio sp. EL58 TaxID=2107582 RepID=UPI000EFB4530|nr:transporter [Aliivibrio sp. EL58]
MANIIEFDYSSFLINSSNQKWTFSQALKSLIPTFGTIWNASVHDSTSTQERLRLEALQVLSSHINDESNIIRLIRLARIEGISDLKIKLPYTLDDEQILYILDNTHTEISQKNDEFDLLLVHLNEPSLK